MDALLRFATLPLGPASMLDTWPSATPWILESLDQVTSKGPSSSKVILGSQIPDLRHVPQKGTEAGTTKL